MSLIERTIRERTHGEPPDRASFGGSDDKWDGYLLGVEDASAVAADQLREAVSREHAVQAIGWLSAEVAVHGAPSLGPEWLELWERALTATGGQ